MKTDSEKLRKLLAMLREEIQDCEGLPSSAQGIDPYMYGYRAGQREMARNLEGILKAIAS